MSSARSSLLFPTFLLILYPVLIHLSLAFQQERIAGALLLAVGLGWVLVDRRRGGRFHPAQLPWAVVALAGLVYLWGVAPERLLFLPPIVMNLFLLGLFASTLRSGRVPLVTQISRLMRGHADPEVDRYTRQVTRMWVVFFALMSVEVAALALFAPLPVWTLFAGFVNYLLILALFLGEYLFRLHRLRGHPHGGLWRFLWALARTDWGRLRF